MIMEAGKSKICSVGQQAGDPEEPMLQFQCQGPPWDHQQHVLLHCSRLRRLDFVFRHLTDCMRHTTLWKAI